MTIRSACAPTTRAMSIAPMYLCGQHARIGDGQCADSVLCCAVHRAWSRMFYCCDAHGTVAPNHCTVTYVAGECCHCSNGCVSAVAHDSCVFRCRMRHSCCACKLLAVTHTYGSASVKLSSRNAEAHRPNVYLKPKPYPHVRQRTLRASCTAAIALPGTADGKAVGNTQGRSHRRATATTASASGGCSVGGSCTRHRTARLSHTRPCIALHCIATHELLSRRAESRRILSVRSAAFTRVRTVGLWRLRPRAFRYPACVRAPHGIPTRQRA